MDYPVAPGINHWYRVVYLRPDEVHRIWPPTYMGASNSLRVVSFDGGGNAPPQHPSRAVFRPEKMRPLPAVQRRPEGDFSL